MKPDFNTRRLYGITRSKGKMFEFNLPVQYHELKLRDADEPQALLMFAIAILADAAGSINDGIQLGEELKTNLEFSSKYFDALLASKMAEEVEDETLLYAAAAYYLVGRPGSSLVMARKIQLSSFSSEADRLLTWMLQAEWADLPEPEIHSYDLVKQFSWALKKHFLNGEDTSELQRISAALRADAYASAHSNDLIAIELAIAIGKLRITSSSWLLLPQHTGVPLSVWRQTISRPHFPKELWPSQRRLASEGIFNGRSGVIQMPTSAGKTRSVEIALKSAFLSNRIKLAVIVAPFNALCNEIGASLRKAFWGDDIKVNELTDALQKDFLKEIAELIDVEYIASKFVFVLTPEKFLYILRQEPSFANDIGLTIFDEAHQFDDNKRGVTYELLVTEIRSLLPKDAQIILISAVISNARSVADWLIGADAPVVDGTGLLPTARSVAFANWSDALGQLMFYESDSFRDHDYFLPRVISSTGLTKKSNREKDRFFPDRNDKPGRDVAIYLGLKLIPEGSVAIFCGRKDQANDVAGRVVEIFDRGYSAIPPANFSNQLEVDRLAWLTAQHYGEDSNFAKAGRFGIFVHHGSIHRGIRLAVEHAMQKDLIKFVTCTSTLAQGVNLPIRYLIVLSTKQSQDEIKVRDFQNLIGRAGRSGMHTEGLIIFSDPAIFGSKGEVSSEFESATKLLVAANSEATTSALLGIVAPFKPRYNYWRPVTVPLETLLALFYSDDPMVDSWAADISSRYKGFSRPEDKSALVGEIRRRKKLCQSLESFLMANRGIESFDVFESKIEELARSTLAYATASTDEQERLIGLFKFVAQVVQQECPDVRKQATFAKTLLGVQVGLRVENWANENKLEVLLAEDNEELLRVLMPILIQESDSKFFSTILPGDLPFEIASLWCKGENFNSIFAFVAKKNGTKPHGGKRRRLSEEDVLKFCENTLSFECGLILGAVSQFLFADDTSDEAKPLAHFLKAMKYGLPDTLSISAFEYGFADRVISQLLKQELRDNGYEGDFFSSAITQQRGVLRALIARFPSYFEMLFP